MFCHECGSKLPGRDLKFCPFCGTPQKVLVRETTTYGVPIEGESPATSTPAPAAAPVEQPAPRRRPSKPIPQLGDVAPPVSRAPDVEAGPVGPQPDELARTIRTPTFPDTVPESPTVPDNVIAPTDVRSTRALRPAAPAPEPVRSEAPTVFDTPAVRPEDLAAARPSQPVRRPVRTPADIPTVEEAAVIAPASAAPFAPPVDDETEKPTELSLPVVTAQDLDDDDLPLPAPYSPPTSLSARPAEPRRAPSPRAPAPVPVAKTPAETASEAGGKKKKFSETAWFMAAVSPENLAEGEGEALDYAAQDRMTDRYSADEPLPDDVRESFSLKSDE